MCKCSGLGEQLSTSLEVVDRVLVPKGTAPGRYVLQWRWDCEESTQVWNSCSDIFIIPGNSSEAHQPLIPSIKDPTFEAILDAANYEL